MVLGYRPDISVFDIRYAQHAVEVLTRWDTVLLGAFNILGSNYTKTEFMLEGQRRRIPVGVLKPLIPSGKRASESQGLLQRWSTLCWAGSYIPGEPVKMSGYSQLTGVPAPLLGEHNKEVYSRLGYSLKQLEDFQRNII